MIYALPSPFFLHCGGGWVYARTLASLSGSPHPRAPPERLQPSGVPGLAARRASTRGSGRSPGSSCSRCTCGCRRGSTRRTSCPCARGRRSRSATRSLGRSGRGGRTTSYTRRSFSRRRRWRPRATTTWTRRVHPPRPRHSRLSEGPPAPPPPRTRPLWRPQRSTRTGTAPRP